MSTNRIMITLFLAALSLQCDAVNDLGGGREVDTDSGEWLISPVFDGGPGKDGIPALKNPEMIRAAEATYLRENDLVIGIVEGDEARAYPHAILDWHEIINDGAGGKKFAITYCPLTGTGIAFDRVIGNTETSFGVSGLLYENNLVPYDRATNSNWSQMLMECVNGQLIGNRVRVYQLIETSWSTWKRMFPGTLVVSTNTGHGRSYDIYPYIRAGSDYRTDHGFVLFPIGFDDTRLRRKDRVHGIIVDERTKAYPFKSFARQRTAINDVLNGTPVVVAVSGPDNLIVSYLRTVSGVDLEFDVIREGFDVYPFNLRSNDGTIWNILGRGISGPNAGRQLVSTVSYNSYWFAWGTFFRGAEIFGQ